MTAMQQEMTATMRDFSHEKPTGQGMRDYSSDKRRQQATRDDNMRDDSNATRDYSNMMRDNSKQQETTAT